SAIADIIRRRPKYRRASRSCERVDSAVGRDATYPRRSQLGYVYAAAGIDRHAGHPAERGFRRRHLVVAPIRAAAGHRVDGPIGAHLPEPPDDCRKRPRWPRSPDRLVVSQVDTAVRMHGDAGHAPELCRTGGAVVTGVAEFACAGDHLERITRAELQHKPEVRIREQYTAIAIDRDAPNGPQRDIFGAPSFTREHRIRAGDRGDDVRRWS